MTACALPGVALPEPGLSQARDAAQYHEAPERHPAPMPGALPLYVRLRDEVRHRARGRRRSTRRTGLIGTDAFQECDIVTVVRPLVKRAWQSRVVVILNNGPLGMVHRWQSMLYDRRLFHVGLAEPADCALVARGFGAAGVTVRSEAELERALAEAPSCARAAVLDVHVEPGEPCFPMIAPGAAAVDMIEWPGT